MVVVVVEEYQEEGVAADAALAAAAAAGGSVVDDTQAAEGRRGVPLATPAIPGTRGLTEQQRGLERTSRFHLSRGAGNVFFWVCLLERSTKGRRIIPRHVCCPSLSPNGSDLQGGIGITQALLSCFFCLPFLSFFRDNYSSGVVVDSTTSTASTTQQY